MIGNGNFAAIASPSDVYNFLEVDLMGALYPLSDGWLDEHNRLIGGIRLSQVNVEKKMKI